MFFGTLFGSFCTSFSGPFAGRFWTYFGPHFGPFSVPKPSKMRVPQEILRNSIFGSSRMGQFWDPFSIRFGKFREGPANVKISIFPRYFDRLAPCFGDFCVGFWDPFWRLFLEPFWHHQGDQRGGGVPP